MLETITLDFDHRNDLIKMYVSGVWRDSVATASRALALCTVNLSKTSGISYGPLSEVISECRAMITSKYCWLLLKYLKIGLQNVYYKTGF